MAFRAGLLHYAGAQFVVPTVLSPSVVAAAVQALGILRHPADTAAER